MENKICSNCLYYKVTWYPTFSDGQITGLISTDVGLCKRYNYDNCIVNDDETACGAYEPRKDCEQKQNPPAN